MTPVIRYLNVGIGGFKCPCCFPSAKNKRKHRKTEFRAAKRRALREAMKIEQEELYV